ncbi:MAG: energy-coupling factor transporter ATPase [Selenomonadales bacterium]|nr:energy-coupling factor transporter ATPase [Selenomonadales bacterium]MEE1362782.1 energy-coupling factor transporter ATPase [Selenomonadaceae bacterium]
MSIILQDVTYTYMPGTPFERTAIENVSIEIPSGKITAIAGHTGSGKSTLIQHLSGLLKPSNGKVLVDDVDINIKNNNESKMARRQVGMVFQYPEQQLFEETVEADIAFGPRNLGLTEEEISVRVKEAMEFVNLDYDTYAKRSPFQLSGGQMRRVAIAGIIAMHPKYLVLDEPVAGLDPRSKEELLKRIRKLHEKQGITIVFISHNMEDIANMADKVIIMNQGKILLEGSPKEVFDMSQADDILLAGLLPPKTAIILDELNRGGLKVDTSAYTVEKGVELIYQALKEAGRC